MFSIVLRPALPVANYGLLTLAAGLAVRNIISKRCPFINLQIKWPNDVLMEGRKCAGILLESAISSDYKLNYVILGIGINVNQTIFPDHLEKKATSLLLESGQTQDRIGLLAECLSDLEVQIDRLGSDSSAFMQEYESQLVGRGSVVRISSLADGPQIEGRMIGIADDGALLIDSSTGIKKVFAGEVTIDK